MIFKRYEFMHKGNFYYLFFENGGYNSEYVDVWMGDSKTNKEVVIYSTCPIIHPFNKVVVSLWLVRLITKGYHDAFMCLFDDDDVLQQKFIKTFKEQIDEKEDNDE